MQCSWISSPVCPKRRRGYIPEVLGSLGERTWHFYLPYVSSDNNSNLKNAFSDKNFFSCTSFYSLQILLGRIAALALHALRQTLNAPPVLSGSQLPSPGGGCWKENTLLPAGLKVGSSLWNLWILSLLRIASPLASCSMPFLASDPPRSFFWTTFAISATRSESDSAFSVGLYLCTWTTSSLSPSSLESSE